MSPLKKFSFTFIAIVCIPALFFLILEGSLRLLGIGTHYDYFEEIEIEGRKYLQDNKAFANQFYPSSLGIAPLNNTIAVDDDKDRLRVLVLGGSAAQGFPHVNHGLDRHLGAQLSAALPSKDVEVINTAMTSVNSHVVYEVARTLPANTADYAIILMGNNEVVGPYGPSTFSQNFLPHLWMIRSLQALKRTHIWQALAMLTTSLQSSSNPQEIEWEGMQMFSEFNVARNDPRLNDVYSHYEDNLRDMIAILQSKNMHVIVSTVPVNLRHSAPFGSSHKVDLTETELSRWQTLNAQAKTWFEQAQWAKAEEAYRGLLDIDEAYADSHFQLARVLEKQAKYDEAKSFYISALEYDTKRFRTNSVLNDIIKNIAKDVAGPQFSFVDNAQIFNELSHPYAPGWNLLHEHVHFDFAGNYHLAKQFTQTLLADLEPTKSFQAIRPDEAAALIGFPNHETNQVMARLYKMVEQAPFSHQINHQDLLTFTAQRKQEIEQTVGSPADVVKRRQTIVQRGLADWKIHYELAELNRFLNDRDAAYYHLDALMKLYPHNHESHLKLAEYLAAKQEFKQANKYLERSLFYTRNDQNKEIQALGLIGLNYMKDEDYEAGKQWLEKITDNYPHQIGANIRAYGLLIKHAKESRQNEDFYRYKNAVQRYAKQIIKQERVNEFPLLYRRMAQIMTLAGDSAEATRWQAMQNTDK